MLGWRVWRWNVWWNGGGTGRGVEGGYCGGDVKKFMVVEKESLKQHFQIQSDVEAEAQQKLVVPNKAKLKQIKGNQKHKIGVFPKNYLMFLYLLKEKSPWHRK